MPLESQKAYLHEITGGYDNEKRREVRKLFSAPSDEDEDDDDEEPLPNIDIVIGILEEFHNINVSTFKLAHTYKVVEIFGLERLFGWDTDGVMVLPRKEIAELMSPHVTDYRLQLTGSNDKWNVPPESHIERLKQQFCVRDVDVIKAALK